MKKVFCLCVVILLTCFTMVSCSFFRNDNRFVGGDLLDEELMSEIRAEIFTDEESDSSDVVEESEGTDKLPEKNEESTEGDDGSLVETAQTEKEGSSENEESTAPDEISTEQQKTIVYWVESGEVWHFYLDCGHLKNSENVFYGTVDEAYSNEKTRVCSSCNKRHESQ